MTPVATTADRLMTDDSFEPLKDYVIAATGLSYYRDRNDELAEHLARRYELLGIADSRAYLQLLNDGPAGDRELDCLIEELTIGETYFFRHPELFQALQTTILPDAIERNQRQRRLRIWSAGSSIGAEAYTISILLRRHLSEQIRDWEITIVGTDINRSYLSRAAQAQFEDWALRGLTDDVKRQCFTQLDDSWQLKPEYRSGVSFLYHNLAKNSYPSLMHNLIAFDVILCRNVMIYFCPTVIANIVDNMRRCLVDGGWLLVGHAEHNPALFREFRTANFPGAIAYQRIDRRNTAPPSPSLAPARPPQFTTARHSERYESRRRRATSLAASQSAVPLQADPTVQNEPAVELAAIRSLADQGAIELAAVRCEQLIKSHKLNPLCHFYQALILEQLGRHAQCERALRRAIYLDRNFMPAHYHLGLTLLRLERRPEAVRTLRNTRRLLAGGDAARILDDADGLTAGDLDDLTRMQLEAIGS